MFRAAGRRRCSLPLILACLLAACAAPPVGPPAAPQPETGFDVQEAYYRRAEALGQKVWRIDARHSLISITVRRGGSLARLGHDHVVACRNVQGFIAPQAQRADFHFRPDQLSVDEAALRAEAGLDTQPSADAIEGTRRNMLTRVLDAQRHPIVFIHVTRAGPAAPYKAAVTLHGVTRTLDVAAQTEAHGDGGGIVVSGALSLNQSDFGIVPFSVLGGAIAVQDRLDVHFRIVSEAR